MASKTDDRKIHVHKVSFYFLSSCWNQEGATSVVCTWSCGKVSLNFLCPCVADVHMCRFISNAEEVKELRECFMGLYSLVDEEDGTKDIIAKVRKNPEKYVLKP